MYTIVCIGFRKYISYLQNVEPRKAFGTSCNRRGVPTSFYPFQYRMGFAWLNAAREMPTSFKRGVRTSF